MANLIITKTTFTVKIEFGIYSEDTNIKSESFRRNQISEVKERFGGTHITVVILDGEDFDISYNTYKHAMVVDLIDGVAPTSNEDLFNKLVALQQV
jgi:hypothetical protein